MTTISRLVVTHPRLTVRRRCGCSELALSHKLGSAEAIAVALRL